MYRRFSFAFVVALILFFVGCTSSVRYSRASMGSSTSKSKSSAHKKTNSNSKKNSSKKHEVLGTASYYGPGFQGKPTASGEKFNMNAMTAAHKTLAFNTKVRVYNLDNGKSVVVKINDRGPYAKNRIIDLSKGAAKKLGMLQTGTANVKLEILTR